MRINQLQPTTRRASGHPAFLKMPAGRSNASALLQKVNSQLRGERVPLKTKEEDELATYLSNLTQKTQQARSFNFDEPGDVSVSSGVDGLRASQTSQDARRTASPQSPVKVSAAASKFLKKKKNVENKADCDQEQEERLNESSRGIVIAGSRPDGRSSKPSTTSALDKASALNKKIKGHASHRHISVDSESEDSLRGSEPVVRPSSADVSIGQDGPKFLKNRKSVEEDKGARVRSPSPHVAKRSSSVEKKKKHTDEHKTKGEIVRTLGRVYLTSEEESLAEFIHGLSVSESSAKRPQNLVAKKQQKWRKKTPEAQQKVLRSSASPVNQRSRSPSPFKRSPSPFGKLSRSQSQDSDLMLDSMASEIMEDRHVSRQHSRQESYSSEDHFNMNLMDAASLLPTSPRRSNNKKGKGKKRPKSATQKKSFPSFHSKSGSSGSFKATQSPSKKRSQSKSSLKKVESASNIFESLGIHMVDELPAAANDRSGDDSDSEIKTEPEDDGFKAPTMHNQSESEIITEIGGGRNFKPATPFRAVVAQSVSELIGSGKYSSHGKVESEHEDTDMDYDYSESFASSESATKTVSSNSSARSQDRRIKRKDRYDSQGPDSYSETNQRKGKGVRKEHKLVVEEKTLDVSTGDPLGGVHRLKASHLDVHVTRQLGLQYVDPAPMATHVVSADALEAITAYSPSMLALQEMMKAQLDLVRNFVDIQNRIYQSCLDGLQYDHQYTTLEDTKAYIEQHRKPRMTFKEALRLVEEEEKAIRGY
ncbi:hypothetical protein ElyMa_005898400 [Elysia marginata]|uniref:DUF4614 domain-containing protein n=1 Tax=Elysia marginata TaxID=1093978 RepID=A0AAV4G4I1_9GAST|nr:hypothetical protein ElyMa_005898400 [Elysia marginata]